jgi:hypothetical protein
MPKIQPDEFGRLRVHDRDTGTTRTIHAAELPHGNYAVLSEPASDVSGNPFPPVHESPVEPTNSGQQADPKKENANG